MLLMTPLRGRPCLAETRLLLPMLTVVFFVFLELLNIPNQLFEYEPTAVLVEARVVAKVQRDEGVVSTHQRYEFFDAFLFDRVVP